MPVGRAVQIGRQRYTRFVGGPAGSFVRPISETLVDIGTRCILTKGKPAPYVTKTPLMGGSFIYSWFLKDCDCPTSDFNRLSLVGRLEGRGHALTAHCWSHLKLPEFMSEDEVRDALVGRIKGDYHLSSARAFDLFGNLKSEQTVSFQFPDDLIFGKMALFG